MAGTSDPSERPLFDAPYPVRAGVVDARAQPAARVPGRGPAGWLNGWTLTARVYEPWWRQRSLELLTRGATTTARELTTLQAWLAKALGPGAEALPSAPLTGRRVLDVGCSSGLYTRTLAAAGADVVALDASRAFLLEARRRATAAGLDPVFVEADAHALPFVDDAFDAVVLGATLNELGDPERALAGFARVLRPGGVLWLMYVDRARGLARAGQAAGERVGLRFPDPVAVDGWAHAAGLTPWRSEARGPVRFASYRLGAGLPPVALSSPSPGWEGGPPTPGSPGD